MVNYCKPAERRLNRDEIVTALKQIAANPAGKYTLKDLCGDAWTTEQRPRAFGKGLFTNRMTIYFGRNE